MSGLKRGFGALKEKKKEIDEQRKQQQASRVGDVYLVGDGASALLWFNGSTDEPVMADFHGVSVAGNNSKDRYMSLRCARGLDDHAGCVLCWATSHGDKRVAKPHTVTVFNVFDMRWVHKRKNDEKTKESGGQFDRFDWFDCSGDPDEDEPDSSCKYCQKKIPREHRGQRKLVLKITAAGALNALNEELKKKCVGCGKKLKFQGFKKGKKIIFDLEDVSDPDEWVATYTCKNCEEAQPGSIFLCSVTFQRNGVGQQTSYAFKEGAFEDLPECVSEATPIVLEDAIAPMSADKMAETLGVENPFDEVNSDADKGSRKKAAGAYDDDDEDVLNDDDDEEGDDE